VSHLPRVISPVRSLFTRDGIEVALVSVEIWPQHIVVRLAGLSNQASADQQRHYEAAFKQWVQLLANAGERGASDPPEQPGTRLLAPLEIAVEDDAGTTYEQRSSNTGGTGSEWHGDWFFVADDLASIERLTVTISSPEGDAATVALDLGTS
jgi:hypothetical protein